MADFKYYAFISYNHKDAGIAKWLHRKLEAYKLPSEIHNEIEGGEKHLRPVFRDGDELNSGILGHELRDRLEESKYLIVMCSPNSAGSAWVSNEIKAFIGMGRYDHIIPLIVDGKPHSYADRDAADAYDDECFPLYLRQYIKENPELELLGIRIPETGKEKAFVKVVSKMLDVKFDTLWDRQKRRKRRQTITGIFAGLAVVAAIAAVWIMNQPKDVTVSVKEADYVNTQLPPAANIIVSLELGTEVKTDTLATFDETAVFKNVPAKMMGKDTWLRIKADHFYDGNINVALDKEHFAELQRDSSVYGHIHAQLYNFERERPAAGVTVSVAGITAVTDANGEFEIDVPIENQAVQYQIGCTGATLVDDTIYMPCQTTAVIEVR